MWCTIIYVLKLHSPFGVCETVYTYKSTLDAFGSEVVGWLRFAQMTLSPFHQK